MCLPESVPGYLRKNNFESMKLHVAIAFFFVKDNLGVL